MTERLAEIIRKHGARTREGGWAECGLSAETCDGCALLAALRKAQDEADNDHQTLCREIERTQELRRRVGVLETCLRSFSLTDVVQWMDDKDAALRDEETR